MSGILETSGFRRRSAVAAAVVVLSWAACGCTFGDRENPSFFANATASEQIFPDNYRPELLAFMRTYLNDPRGIREAAIAMPELRTVEGRQRYIVCTRYNARESDGGYPGVKDRAILYVAGRLDRVIENSAELCDKAAYKPFPEMEKLTRAEPPATTR